MLLLTVYAATIVPYEIAFGESGLDYSYFELTVDLFFLFDLVLTFFTPYEFFDGTLQYSHKKIAMKYILRGPFWIDFIACLPPQLFTINNS